MQTQFLNTAIDIEAGLLPLHASAVVFDCDGLLADTESLWLRAVAVCAGRYGIETAGLGDLRGVSIDDAAVLLASGLNTSDMDKDSVLAIATCLTAEFDRLISEKCVSMPGAVQLVDALARRLPVAVASNSPRVQLDRILRGIGLEELISRSVSRDDVSSAKPAPDLYLEAVNRLALENAAVVAETAVAFEDSAAGSRAATSAGLFVVGVNPDEGVLLTCHARYLSLSDDALSAWASSVSMPGAEPVDEPARIISSYDADARTARFYCRVPDGQRARVEIYPQKQCRWNEKPAADHVAFLEIDQGETEVTLNLGELDEGTYRYFLLTDGQLPEWNGRTGEIVIEALPDMAELTVSPISAMPPDSSVEVMTWNLWFGGCHSNDGLSKQIAYVTQYPHHIVALQECFAVSGRRLARSLGWNIAQQGDDTAILTAFPVTLHETTTNPFATCATIHLPSGPVTVWSVHLWHADYGPYTGNNPEIPVPFTLTSRGERLRTAQLARVLIEQQRLERVGVVTAESPVILAGDFNVPSHLDWQDGQRGNDVEWPISKMLELAGYEDAFRKVHPNAAGHTWSPIIAATDEPRDRIDFVYTRGGEPVDAHIVAADPDFSLGGAEVRRIGQAAEFMGSHLENLWPTDHAAVVAHIRLE